MPYIFKIWQITTNIIACISPDYHIFHTIWLKLDENLGNIIFLNITSEILQSALSNPELNSKNRHKKYPTYAVHRTVNSKFSSVSLYDQPISRYCTFYDFPTDSHVKI